MVDHWFDFICPFCYVGQSRTAILREAGREVEERAFAIHPEIGPGGARAPERLGPTYDLLAEEAGRAGLPLVWSPTIPWSRPALIVAELVRVRHHDRHPRFVETVFDAYFGQGEDIEQPAVLIRSLRSSGLDEADLLTTEAHAAGAAALTRSEAAAHAAGVTGTPAWRVDGRLINGLQPEAAFRALATGASR